MSNNAIAALLWLCVFAFVGYKIYRKRRSSGVAATSSGNVAKTFYDVLGVQATASTENIRMAYRRRAQVYHPDKSTGDGVAFKEINEAHQVLSNGYRRKLYDMQLSANEAQAIAKQSIDPKVVGLNVLVSIAFFAIGIVCVMYGDQPAPNYSGWLVALFWMFVALACVRLKYRQYRFRHYGEFLRAAFIDTVAFLLAEFGVLLIIGLVAGVLGWITKLYRKVRSGQTVDITDLRRNLATVESENPELYRKEIGPRLDSWAEQYGDRIPLEEFEKFYRYVTEQAERSGRERQQMIDRLAAEGKTLEMTALRQHLEKEKAEYQGPDRGAFARQLDLLVESLEATYGSNIPIDEAYKLVDRLESGAGGTKGVS
jgi:curved DNA-binding protein CbpA